MGEQALKRSPVKFRLFIQQYAFDGVGTNEFGQFGHGDAVAQIVFRVQVQNVENTLPRLVFVVAWKNARSKVFQPSPPVQIEVRVKMEDDEFAENGAQLRGVVRGSVMDETGHFVPLLPNRIQGEKGMEGMGKPEGHRDQERKVPDQRILSDDRPQSEKKNSASSQKTVDGVVTAHIGEPLQNTVHAGLGAQGQLPPRGIFVNFPE